MLPTILATCAALIFILALAIPHAAETRRLRLARLLQAQEEWAEMMDRNNSPRKITWLRSTATTKGFGTSYGSTTR